MKEHVFRLVANDDLKTSIISYCVNNNIKAAVIVCGVGCVKAVCIRKAKAEEIYRDHDDYEIVALQGTIANDKAHIHIALSDKNMKTIGGHLMVDTIINTTAEIVLFELEEYILDRKYDEQTGYDELVVNNKRI